MTSFAASAGESSRDGRVGERKEFAIDLAQKLYIMAISTGLPPSRPGVWRAEARVVPHHGVRSRWGCAWSARRYGAGAAPGLEIPLPLSPCQIPRAGGGGRGGAGPGHRERGRTGK